MLYLDVISNNLHTILPAKGKYTKADIDRVMIYSLFNPINGRTFTEQEACFIVICTATLHGAELSNTIKMQVKQ